MKWPTSGDYRVAVQDPAHAFRDPYLQQCQVERNPRGLPRPRSGAFALTFKLIPAAAHTRPGQTPSLLEYIHGDSEIALRLFLYHNPERLERFRVVAYYLAGHRTKGLVDVKYSPDGIRIE